MNASRKRIRASASRSRVDEHAFEAIAVRNVSLGDKHVVLRIGVPERTERGDYSCKVQIAGTGHDDVDRAYGADAFQALIEALRYFPWKLGERLSSIHDDAESDHGIPLILYKDARGIVMDKARRGMVELLELAWQDGFLRGRKDTVPKGTGQKGTARTRRGS